MTRIRKLAYTQGKYLLENYRQALLCAVLLAVFSYTAWLSSAVIALITLRRGVKEGGLLLVAAVLVHCLLAQMQFSFFPALVSSLLNFVPCFFAACLLRLSASWRAVAGILFAQVLFVMMLLQWGAHDFILAQFAYFQSVVRDLQADGAFSHFLSSMNSGHSAVLANYLLGIQAAGVVFSAVLSLALARAVQSLICNPGGFTREMLEFRGQKMELLLLVGILFMVNLGSALAINLLPVMLFYFLLAGLSLSFNLFAKEKPYRSIVLLILPMIFLPIIMFFVYVIFGSLDSLFNFRLYLHRADERMRG